MLDGFVPLPPPARMNRPALLLGLCFWLLSSPVAAQSRGSAPPEAALLAEPAFSAWARCIEHRVQVAFQGPEPPAEVVAGAFKTCGSDEQRLMDVMTARLGADGATT